MRRVLLVAAGAVVLLVGGLWLAQRRLIYLPDRSAPLPPPGVEEVELFTDDGLTLGAWWVEGEPAVLVLPGNAGNRSYRIPLANELAERGLGVLLVDYRGYGGNPGTPSEPGLLHDAVAARRFLSERGVDEVVYLGESLGAGPAAALARRSPPRGLVLRSPFTSLPEVAAVHYRFLPTGWMLWDRFPVEELVSGSAVPTWVVAGTADSVVPFRLSQRVAETAGAQLVVVEGADHNHPDLAWGAPLVSAVVEAAG